MDVVHVDEATGQKTPVESRKRKRKASQSIELEEEHQVTRYKKLEVPKKWKNKQRVLVFCARGVTYRSRHLMNDLKMLLPHSRADTKLDRKDKLPVINEADECAVSLHKSVVRGHHTYLQEELVPYCMSVCEMKNCTKCIFFEMRKKKDLYMWVSNVPSGPSAKLLVENVHTMDELKLSGNCLLGSRPLLSFDASFGDAPHLELLKELLTQTFTTPVYHPKSKPFTDHLFHFGILDGRIWFRNYQIAEEGGSLTEIGPRFVLNLIKVFEGSFGGPTLYENPSYITPNVYRRLMRMEATYKYKKRVNARKSLAERKAQEEADKPVDPLDGLFGAN